MRIFPLIWTILLGLTFQVSAQSYWTSVDPDAIVLNSNYEPVTRHLDQYETYQLDMNQLKAVLIDAPLESEMTVDNRIQIQLPMPNGRIEVFEVWESPVMEPGLAAKYPEIKSYKGTSTENYASSVRFDISPFNFHAAIRTLEGKVYIDPIVRDQGAYYASYYIKNAKPESVDLGSDFCGVEHHEHDEDTFIKEIQSKLKNYPTAENRGAANEIPLRTYRFAVTCNGEFSNDNGGTITSVLAAVNTVTNRINEVLEVDIAARLLLVDNNDQLVFLNPLTDPFPDAGNMPVIIGQNTGIISDIIGQNNFDIGHYFSGTCGGGVLGIASLSSVCGNNKGSGATCFPVSNLDFVAITIVAHELGHQFSGTHTFNNCGGDNGNVTGATAFEPGAGSTILAYSSVCNPSQSYQNFSSDYYHVGSLEQLIFFTREIGGDNCPEYITTGNTEPVVEIPQGNGFRIPISTPFELTAVATDAENDDLTYCWEQYNQYPTGINLGNPISNGPAFRTYPPVANPTRVFPRLPVLVNNGSENVEVLPTYSRNFKFKCTVRDNNPLGGATVWEEIAFEATDQAGPFLVETPNTGSEVWQVGETATVTWDVANTDQGPVNCQLVDIYLSLDGGFTYPIMVAENIPNNGETVVTIPNVETDQARIKVKAANNIFFDISNQNFTIEVAEPGYFIATNPLYQKRCLPTDEITIDILSQDLLGYDSTVTLSIEGGLPNGAVAEFSSNPFLPSEGSSLSINMEDVNDQGIFEIELKASAPGQDDKLRIIRLELVSTDFSAISLTAPENGSSGISELPTFEWTLSPNAEDYAIEIATSPEFGASIVEQASGLTQGEFTPSVTLEENTLYYWRIKPTNECITEEPALPNAFHTLTLNCTTQSNNNSVPISSQGTPTVTSTINIPADGTISDVNIPSLKGTHEFVSYLRVGLISPQGTKVVFFQNLPCNSANFNLGLDDQAPSYITSCPTGGTVYRPDNQLADLNGESTQGDWILELKVTDGAGSGGEIEKWSLELCSDIVLNPPNLVINDTMGVQEGASRLVTPTFLLTEDQNNTPVELVYTLVKEPEHGQLYIFLDEAFVGSKFLQYGINNARIWYQHTGTAADSTDSFYFTVTDGEGGWIGITQFNIVLDEDAQISSGIQEVGKQQLFTLFPNPANNYLQIDMKQPLTDNSRFRLINMAGKTIEQFELPQGTTQHMISTSDLPTGLYLIQLFQADQLYTEKVVIQR